MNIGELTTGYFSKCDIERELIISRILGECLIEIEVGGVTQKRLKEHIKMLQDKRFVKFEKVSDFIDAMDALIKIL